MAELAKLEIEIGAKVDQATKGFDQAAQKVEEFARVTEKSVDAVEKSFADLGKSVTDVSKVNAQVLPKIADNLDKIAVPAKRAATEVTNVGKAVGSIGKSSRDGSAALFSLSQVARDLPFGFIAIQNNLPQVVDSFSSLSKSSGGVFNALKAVGGAMLGPAGIGFAFSAVTSIATSLISKYGSIAAGLDAIFSSSAIAVRGQKALASAFGDAAASVAGEIQTVRNLTNALADNNRTQEERKNAYLILKKEYPGIIQNMTLEKALTQEGTALLAERSNELIKYIMLKGKESAIIKLVEEETKKQLQAQRELDRQSSKIPTSALDFFGPNAFNTAAGLGKLGVAAEKAGEGAAYYSKELQKVQDEILKIDQQIVNFDKGDKQRQKSIDDILRARLESQKRLIEQELAGVSILSDRWLKLSTDLKNIEAQIKLVGVKDPQTISNIKQEFQNEINKLGPLQMQAKIDAGKIDFQSLLQVDQETAVKRISDLVSSILKTGYEEAAKKAGTVRGKVEIIPSESVALAIQQVQQLKQELTDIGNMVGGALADAFGTLWDKVASEGKISLQDVGNAVKKLVIDLIKAAIQAAILKVVLNALGVGGGSGSSGIFNALAGKITGLASGGIVTKPTLAMIGEGGEKEAVIPLSKLPGLMGSSGGSTRVVGVIRGSDLLLSNARETRKQLRG